MSSQESADGSQILGLGKTPAQWVDQPQTPTPPPTPNPNPPGGRAPEVPPLATFGGQRAPGPPGFGFGILLLLYMMMIIMIMIIIIHRHASHPPACSSTPQPVI